VTAPIVSATSVAQLAELLKATSLTLDESAIKHLNAASD
jgi:aryl-alcohol dehydrogenase-like predicted oxidoreductase